MRNGGLQAFVHGNRALFRCLHASGFKVEPHRERAAARREQDGIRGQRLFRAVENETDLGFIPGVAYGTGGCTGYDRYTLFSSALRTLSATSASSRARKREPRSSMVTREPNSA